MNRFLLLLAGSALTALVPMRLGLSVLAWFAPVPWLLWWRDARGLRHAVLFIAVLFATWTLATFKIITDPIPAAFAPLFAAGVVLFQAPAWLVWRALHGRVRPGVSALLFATLMVAAEWAQHRLSPFASWGAAANTQLDHLPLLQLASLGGIAAVGFLVHWTGALLASWKARELKVGALAPLAAVLVLAQAWGSARLGLHDERGGEALVTAAVGTDSTVSGLPLPSVEQRQEWEAELFERTRTAAGGGARVVVWNEASVALLPSEEPGFRDRVGALARELGVHVVAGVVVPVSAEPFRFENKALWFGPDGKLLDTHHKNFPVPGEPASPGEPQQASIELDGARAGTAICYDFDFPLAGRHKADLGLDLVALPSSDWRGIDPIHTQMAALRAIEGGFSVVRSTRFGLSAAIDPVGRLRGWRSSHEGGPGVLLSTVPLHGSPTLYGAVGDLPLLLWCLVMAVAVARRRRRAVGEREGGAAGAVSAVRLPPSIPPSLHAHHAASNPANRGFAAYRTGDGGAMSGQRMLSPVAARTRG